VDIVATYRAIPYSAFGVEIRSLDKERRDKNWDVKRILAEAVIKFNDTCTKEEWLMDLKKVDAPPDPLALPAYQRESKPQPWKSSKGTDYNFMCECMKLVLAPLGLSTPAEFKMYNEKMRLLALAGKKPSPAAYHDLAKEYKRLANGKDIFPKTPEMLIAREPW
jgi:hypothetical protein